MIRTVTLSTGSRLHFGPLSYRPAEGRHFGGVGLMIDEPGCEIVMTRSTQDDVTGETTVLDRVRRFVARTRVQSPADRPPPCRINVVRSIPPHAGLGSGTQLGLAVARGLAEISGEPEVSVETLAARVERGRRSAVGLYGFAAGGLIVDAGKRAGDDIGTLACRLEFPAHWRVMLLTPSHGRPGLSGHSEEQAFARLGSMPAALADRLCRIVLTELLPAVRSANFDDFSEAVFDYGSRVGEFFRSVQGGTFGDSQTDELIRQLTRHGARGVGQTSWGPTLFAFVASARQGEELAERIAKEGTTGLKSCAVRMVAPKNTGATVTVID
ncbi:MAG: beta-ribofuranosylaminobenzene 5'-phosphate synthase family protein [Planctomycetaceae bacterium]